MNSRAGVLAVFTCLAIGCSEHEQTKIMPEKSPSDTVVQKVVVPAEKDILDYTLHEIDTDTLLKKRAIAKFKGDSVLMGKLAIAMFRAGLKKDTAILNRTLRQVVVEGAAVARQWK